jgi:hypothetical protein
VPLDARTHREKERERSKSVSFAHGWMDGQGTNVAASLPNIMGFDRDVLLSSYFLSVVLDSCCRIPPPITEGPQGSSSFQ